MVEDATVRSVSTLDISHATKCPASAIEANANPGARDTPRFNTAAAQPPASVIVRAPRLYDATNAASVVASGT